ncbi:MAG: VOC family protein [Candidatus Sericytochromatia bacterium]
MLFNYSASLDVPDLDAGLAFYGAVFGFVEVARPVPGVLVMRAGQQEICLLERPADSAPAPGSPDTRRYTRHWTPVHLDFHVTDFEAVVARARAAGALCEALHAHPKHGSVAFCSDPFGHGFCLIERRELL